MCNNVNFSDLLSALRERNDLKDVIEQAGLYFDAPIILMDENLRILARTETLPEDMFWKKAIIENSYAEFMTHLVWHAEDMRAKEKPLFHDLTKIPDNKTLKYWVTINENQTAIALVLFPRQKVLPELQMESFRAFAWIVHNTYFNGNRIFASPDALTLTAAINPVADSYYQDFRLTKPTDKNPFRKFQSACVLVINSDIGNTGILYSFYCEQILRDIIGESLITTYHDLLIAFCKPLGNNQLHQLKELADEWTLRMGISWSFTPHKNIKKYYKQAHNALTLGSDLQKSQRIYLYDFWHIGLIVKKLEKEVDLTFYPDPFPNELIQYDKENSASLHETLYQLLFNNFHMSETAAILGIHKNTLSRRFEKIKELYKNDLSDPKLQSGLMMSYIINMVITNGES